MKTFQKDLLIAKPVKITNFFKNGELKFLYETEFGNWRSGSIKGSKRQYRAFMARYKRNSFHPGKMAYLAIYDGRLMDVELVYSEEELEESSLDLKDKEALMLSLLKINVERIHEDSYFDNGWLFDGAYAFKSAGKQYSVMAGVRLKEVKVINLEGLKSSTDISSVESGYIRDVLEVEVAPGDWRMSTTLTKTLKDSKTSRATFWRKALGNPSFLENSFLNIETSLRYAQTIGKCYGNKAASDVDYFSVVLQLGAFPFKVDNASKSLVEYERVSETGGVLSGLDGIRDLLKKLVLWSSEEEDFEKLNLLAGQLTHMSQRGITHSHRLKKIFKNKDSQALLNKGFISLNSGMPSGMSLSNLSLENLYEAEKAQIFGPDFVGPLPLAS